MARAASEGLNTLSPPLRSRFQGVAEVVRFNWPYYALAAAIIGAAMTLEALLPIPEAVSLLLRLGILVVAFWIVASILVTFYVYDLSPLHRWEWLAPLIGVSPKSWANFHAGLDETTPAIRALYPNAPGMVFDIYDSTRMTEPSIARARARSMDRVDKAIMPEAIPLADSEIDAVFLIFVAHEIRDAPDRVRFFRELARIVRANGRLVLVEHLRDIWNFAAYGPGFKHFFPRNEWIRVATSAGFSIQAEASVTPFVRCFVFGAPPSEA
jgi:SAM-dependent methyltransferase